MKIAIIEDEQIHSELLKKYIQDWAAAGQHAVNVSVYASAEQFLFAWEDEIPEVLFVDIQMPGMNGMEMVRKVRERSRDVAVIFTTGVSDYIGEGYEVEALHYLLKPLSPAKVSECLDKAVLRCKAEDFCVFSTAEGTCRFPAREINAVEAAGHFSLLHCTGERHIEVRHSFAELEKQLVPKGFFKCHRSYLCNVGNIYQITKDTVLFDDRSAIPVSRRLFNEVNQAFIRRFSRNGQG